MIFNGVGTAQVADLNCAVEAQQVCMGKTGVIKF